MQYRNTPSSQDGLSPAQKLFGHPVQDTLPAHPKSFDPQEQTNLDRAAEKAECSGTLLQQTGTFITRDSCGLPGSFAGSMN